MASENKATPSPPPGRRRSPRFRDKPLPKTSETTKEKTVKKSPKPAAPKKPVQQTSRTSKRSRDKDESEDELAQDTPVKRAKTPEKKAPVSDKETVAKNMEAKETTSKETAANDTKAMETTSQKTAAKDVKAKETTSKDTTSEDTAAKNTSSKPTTSKGNAIKEVASGDTTSEVPDTYKISSASRSITNNFFLDAILTADPQSPRVMGEKPTPRKTDKEVAKETAKILPELMASMVYDNHTRCEKLTLQSLKPLTKPGCPNREPCKIKVVNEDTIDAAMRLNIHKRHDAGPVIVLNMANATSPGSGWMSGALAQEECIFWRTTLSASLRKEFYPLATDEALYTPSAAVIRESRADGHRRYDPKDGWYPNVAVMSVAAKCNPGKTTVMRDDQRVELFKNEAERERAKYNARICLRMAARKGHRDLVLGALGCGVFGNPRHDTAECWKEVFQEDEFQGGWWDSVVFAVLDSAAGKNITVYRQILEGLQV